MIEINSDNVTDIYQENLQEKQRNKIKGINDGRIEREGFLFIIPSGQLCVDLGWVVQSLRKEKEIIDKK